MHRVLRAAGWPASARPISSPSGAFMSYWPVWLHERGITDAELGTLFMARQMVSVVSMLAMGLVAHRLGASRGMLVALAAAAIGMMGVYQIRPPSWRSAGRVGVGLRVVADHGALRRRAGQRDARARLRLRPLRMWSSVAFILGALACGLAVDRWGPPSVLYVSACGIVLMAPLALALPPSASRARERDGHAPFGFFDLLRSRPFQLFMVATGLCQASHAVLYSFGTLTWRAAGLDDVTISALWGLSVAVEILLMMASGWLIQRLGVTGLIALGLACGIVRWTGMAFTTALPALIVLQMLHAGTFAAAHIGAMGFIQRAVPPSGAALGQSIYYALGTGATQAVVFQLAGLLYARVGQHAFLGMAVISTIGLGAMLLLMRRWKGELLVGTVER